MLTTEQLKQAVHRQKLSKTDTVLLCVAAKGGKDVSALAARSLAVEVGVKKVKDTNFSAHLHSAEDKVFKTPRGWELTEAGRKHVATLAAQELSSSPAAVQAQALRDVLPQIKNEGARAFVQEAIVCAEQSLFRAAVVLSWVGAMSLLHDHVVTKHLPAFNAEAVKRNARWRPAQTADDLGTMKEATFLEVIQTISIIGKNVKQELETCLKLRNGCGHPNSLSIGPNKVAAHIEVLVLNVFKVFG